MPALWGEMTSPQRKPHGPCKWVKLWATSIQAWLASQHTRRPSSPATWGTVISSSSSSRRGRRCMVWRLERGSMSSLSHSSDRLSSAVREDETKVHGIFPKRHLFVNFLSGSIVAFQSISVNAELGFWCSGCQKHCCFVVKLLCALSKMFSGANQLTGTRELLNRELEEEEINL